MADGDGPEETRRRMYSAAYQEGQRLSSWPAALAKAEDDAVKYDDDPHFVKLGVREWSAGFRDGWHGRVPVYALRLVDAVL